MPIVTIRGLYGSYSADIAREVARRLGAPHLDHELLVEVARRLGLSVEEVEQLERVPTGVRHRILEAFARGMATTWFSGTAGLLAAPLAYDPTAVQLPTPVTEEDYRRALENLIRDLASLDTLVLRGRGTQVMLRDRETAFHVFITAPLEVRVRRVMEMEGVDEATAKRRIDQEDGRRRAFVRRYFNADLEDINLYDLVISTAKVGRETAVDVIVQVASTLG